jgi:hypothetical protein
MADMFLADPPTNLWAQKRETDLEVTFWKCDGTIPSSRIELFVRMFVGSFQ